MTKRFANLSEIAAFLSIVIVLVGLIGKWHFAFDLASHFRVQATVALVVTCPIIFWLGRRRWAVVSGVAGVLLAASLAPFWLPRSNSTPAEYRLLSMNVLSEPLKRYGIKQHNWLEAKFLRTNKDGKPTYDKLKVVLLLIKDLIRLSVFPPEKSPPDSTASRYLLHGYKSEPKYHLARKKNTKDDVKGFTRSWTERIRQPGQQKLDSFNLDREVGQFDKIVGANLRQLSLELKVTNFTYVPRNGGADDYWLFLTRLDEISVKHSGKSFQIIGSTLEETPDRSYNKIGKFVAENIAA